jgi:hypothetical protein
MHLAYPGEMIEPIGLSVKRASGWEVDRSRSAKFTRESALRFWTGGSGRFKSSQISNHRAEMDGRIATRWST